MDAPESIGARLRWSRKTLGFNQADWCRLVGIVPQAWNNYERELRVISINQSLKVCETTELSLDWIYRGVTTGLPKTFAEKIRNWRTRRA
jgi:transcriptional regulator with XRE-family HTH domain